MTGSVQNYEIHKNEKIMVVLELTENGSGLELPAKKAIGNQ